MWTGVLFRDICAWWTLRARVGTWPFSALFCLSSCCCRVIYLLAAGFVYLLVLLLQGLFTFFLLQSLSTLLLQDLSTFLSSRCWIYLPCCCMIYLPCCMIYLPCCCCRVYLPSWKVYLLLLHGLSTLLQGIPSWWGDRKGSNMDVQVGAYQFRLSLLSLLSLLRERDDFLDEVVQAGDAESQWKAIQVIVTLCS